MLHLQHIFRKHSGASAQYQAWADGTGVLDWNLLLQKLLKAWNMETVDG